MNRSTRRTAFAVTAPLLAALSLLAATPARPRFGELVIEDVDLAAWMNINNTFMIDPNNPQKWDRLTQEWDGVLIQLGHYNDVGDIFKSITFERQGRVQHELTSLGDFEWINIVAEDPLPGRKPPMDSKFVGLLHPDKLYHTVCDDLDASAGQNRLCLKQSCSANDLKPIPKVCVRLRSLHGYFDPEPIITYWQGPYGYEVSVGPQRHDAHSRHTFTFNDEVKIYIDNQLLKKGRIDTIRINMKEDNRVPRPHGGLHTPPWGS